MINTRNRLYSLILIGCLVAYFLLFWSVRWPEKAVSVCLFKQITTLPCPSCGSTRAIVSLVNGFFFQALMINPLGLILVALLIVLPFWVFFDFLFAKQSLFLWHKQANSTLRNPRILFPFLLLITVNWIWNITKHL